MPWLRKPQGSLTPVSLFTAGSEKRKPDVFGGPLPLFSYILPVRLTRKVRVRDTPCLDLYICKSADLGGRAIEALGMWDNRFSALGWKKSTLSFFVASVSKNERFYSVLLVFAHVVYNLQRFNRRDRFLFKLATLWGMVSDGMSL